MKQENDFVVQVAKSVGLIRQLDEDFSAGKQVEGIYLRMLHDGKGVVVTSMKLLH